MNPREVLDYPDDDIKPAVRPAQARYVEQLERRMDSELDRLDVIEVDGKGRVVLGARPGKLYIVDYHPGGVIVLQPAVVVTKAELDQLLRVR